MNAITFTSDFNKEEKKCYEKEFISFFPPPSTAHGRYLINVG
jgi:hypothetical protein